jgi:sugar/nucleoside kinase (ribokinase family)
MTKIGKTFTIDLDVYNWLVQHAKDKNRKVSFVVNLALRKIKNQTQTWTCPECGTSNGNQFSDCHKCDYVLSFKDVPKS